MIDRAWTLRQTSSQIQALNGPIIARLQNELRAALSSAVDGRSRYALLDFPNHSNIGDSAIYLGEAILCREHFGRAPELVMAALESDLGRIASLDRDVVLLLHGGGNFGDLYPRHQTFREAVLSRFPDRKIVLLPQSIHFSDEVHAAGTAAVVAAHPDFTIMVRDHASMAFAKHHFGCKVMLVPDMAFMIGAVTPRRGADLRVLGLMREDIETVLADRGGLERLPQPFAIVDWPSEMRRRRVVDRLPNVVRRLLPQRRAPNPVNPSDYEGLAQMRVERGFQLLSRGKIVVTDRLHAHIMSFLLGIPHIALDNSYRKIGNFVDAWTHGGGFVQVETIDEAVHCVVTDR